MEIQRFQTAQTYVPSFNPFPSQPASAPAAPSFGLPDLLQLLASSQLMGRRWGDFAGSQPAPAPSPFFDRFLEDQHKVGRPPIAMTQAYPSDSDHDNGPRPGGPPIATMAYPSDSDHDGGIKPPPIAVTQAYPSDSDHDGGIKPPPIATMAYPSDSDHDGGIKPPPIAVTQAYPSDSDTDGGIKPPPIAMTQAYPSDSDHDVSRFR